MNYQQLTELPSGTRLNVWRNGKYHKATFHGHIRGADPSAWIAFDELQIPGERIKATRVYTGLQFTEEDWNGRNKEVPQFLLLTEDELNAELVEGLETVS